MPGRLAYSLGMSLQHGDLGGVGEIYELHVGFAGAT